MKTIALLSNTEIINKIFTLIANKLMLQLKITKRIDSIDHSVDLVVIDDAYLGENIIKLRSQANAVVLLKGDETNEEGFDFIIEKPFLPSVLSIHLENILKEIDNRPKVEKIDEVKIFESEEPTNEEVTDDLAKFIDNLVQEVDEDSHNQNDLTVKKEQLGHGGVLDKDELSKLFDMINDDVENPTSTFLKGAKNEDDWIDLSDIIDNAIDDVSSHQPRENVPIKILLNNYSMEELAPLLEKLNQNVVDRLSDGETINLQLRLEKNG